MLERKKINIVNTIFLIALPIVSLISLPIWLKSSSYSFNTVILAIVFYVLAQLSITAGYHRYFSHKSYDAHPLVSLFYLCFGAAAFQGTALKWSQDHRRHHRFVDDIEKDPYSIKKGFMWAHILWLFYEGDKSYNPEEVPDLVKDKLVMFQHKHIIKMSVFFAFVLPMLLGAIWGDALGGLFIAGALRLTINHHSTFFINSLAHTLGDQKFSNKHSSRDNFITAVLTFGEGYHNFHHEFPSDYRNGIRFFDFDPTKWLIASLSKLKLASNLKTVDQEVIMKKMAIMAVINFESQCKAFQLLSISKDHMIKVASHLKSDVEKAFSRLKELKRARIITVSVNEKHQLSKQISKAKKDFDASCKLLFGMLKRFENKIEKEEHSY